MRINKFLASTGLGSRRKCEEYVTSGRVTINGKVETNLAFDVSEKDEVLIDGKQVCTPKEYVYLMMHKPKGYLTTVTDDRNRKTVMELLPAEFKHLMPVGRLDYNSEGLLLFTNNGDIAQKIMRPAREVIKTYSVKVEGEVTETGGAFVIKRKLSSLKNLFRFNPSKLWKRREENAVVRDTVIKLEESQVVQPKKD